MSAVCPKISSELQALAISPMPRLNQKYVQSLVSDTARERVFMDEEVPSFGVRVSAAGRKTYFVRYRVGGGRGAQERRQSLGCHPVVSAEQARQAAKDVLARARLGADPMKERREINGDVSVGELITLWLDGPGHRTRKGRPRKPMSVYYDRGRLMGHVVPVLGSLRLRELKRHHIEMLRDKISSGKTATRKRRTKPRGVAGLRGGEGVATRTLGTFSSVLSYAVDHGLIERNPALGVHRVPAAIRQRFLSPEEIGRVTAAFDVLEHRFPHGVRILRLLLLTGCRAGEIANLTWDEIDFETGHLRLRTSKTGARPVPLSDVAVEALRAVPRVGGSPYLFPGRSGQKGYSGVAGVWKQVLSVSEIGHARIHDLRHTVASTALAGGASLSEIAAILGHTELRTTARYAHVANAAVKRAVDYVGAIVAGDSSASAAAAAKLKPRNAVNVRFQLSVPPCSFRAERSSAHGDD